MSSLVSIHYGREGFPEQTEDALCDAVSRFLSWEHRFEPAVLRRSAERFGSRRFIRHMRRMTEYLLADRSGNGLRMRPGLVGVGT